MKDTEPDFSVTLPAAWWFTAPPEDLWQEATTAPGRFAQAASFSLPSQVAPPRAARWIDAVAGLRRWLRAGAKSREWTFKTPAATRGGGSHPAEAHAGEGARVPGSQARATPAHQA